MDVTLKISHILKARNIMVPVSCFLIFINAPLVSLAESSNASDKVETEEIEGSLKKAVFVGNAFLELKKANKIPGLGANETGGKLRVFPAQPYLQRPHMLTQLMIDDIKSHNSDPYLAFVRFEDKRNMMYFLYVENNADVKLDKGYLWVVGKGWVAIEQDVNEQQTQANRE